MKYVPILVVLLYSCGMPSAGHLSRGSEGVVLEEPDYSRPDAWAALPFKEDAADKTPGSLKDRQAEARADVFFVYPTIYVGRGKLWNADVYAEQMNRKIDSSAIKYQASLFNGAGRVFAPRYRQAHLRAFYTDADNEDAQEALKLAYTDVVKAFTYYLEHYNEGRPIIIAGHSQGALMSMWLLRDFFDGKPLRKQLVAAYLAGWPVKKDQYETIPVCERPEQTGCFCSWRSFRYGYVPRKFPLGDTIAVVNPLSWQTNEAYVPASESKGSVLRDFETIYAGIADAQIVNGILWLHKPKFPGSVFVVRRNYHVADFNLYYLDVRENARRRVEAFLE